MGLLSVLTLFIILFVYKPVVIVYILFSFKTCGLELALKSVFIRDISLIHDPILTGHY